MEQILQLAGIPVLSALACIYFSVKLLVFKDTDSIRGNMDRKLKDKEAYALGTGRLLLALGVCSMVMAALLFINIAAALLFIGLSLIVIFKLWTDVEKKYGAP